MKKEEFIYNGKAATVILPDNPNGKWVWKTEFLYAFDKAETELSSLGFTRVYYSVSNKYGSPDAVRLMRSFYDFVTKKYDLLPKCILFGFSIGGLYAVNFALEYPSLIERIYLDAPVLDLESWPPENSDLQAQMLSEYGITKCELPSLAINPVKRIDELLSLELPMLIIAGDADEVVPFEKNSGLLIERAASCNKALKYIIKPGCLHHPHSLDDVEPIINFCTCVC